MDEVTTTDEERARAAALSEIGASAAQELIASVEKDVGAADTVGVLSGVIDACGCYIACAASPDIAAQILSDVSASLEERLRQVTTGAH